jgi:CD2 antigen cytoplasmic tail-binding protein 2
LKGRSNKSKEKMPTETQLLFDQLTEDANKLLDHGEYS